MLRDSAEFQCVWQVAACACSWCSCSSHCRHQRRRFQHGQDVWARRTRCFHSQWTCKEIDLIPCEVCFFFFFSTCNEMAYVVDIFALQSILQLPCSLTTGCADVWGNSWVSACRTYSYAPLSGMVCEVVDFALYSNFSDFLLGGVIVHFDWWVRV